METNICSYNTFTSRPCAKRVLPHLNRAMNSTFRHITFPSKSRFDTITQKYLPLNELRESNYKLKFVRSFVSTLYGDGGLPEYFRGLLGCVQSFKVANCSEFAEISKTVLKMNGVKNCDIFELCAKKVYGNSEPRALDHVVTAIGVTKNKNNKLARKPFVPSKNTVIADMYLDGYVGKYKDCRSIYEKFGLEKDEILLFKPVQTYEPDQNSLELIRKDFPGLIIRK